MRSLSRLPFLILIGLLAIATRGEAEVLSEQQTMRVLSGAWKIACREGIGVSTDELLEFHPGHLTWTKNLYHGEHCETLAKRERYEYRLELRPSDEGRQFANPFAPAKFQLVLTTEAVFLSYHLASLLSTAETFQHRAFAKDVPQEVTGEAQGFAPDSMLLFEARGQVSEHYGTLMRTSAGPWTTLSVDSEEFKREPTSGDR